MAAANITVTPEKFQLVLGVNVSVTISITNVGFDAVMYRLLTTAPERYVVKHTKGVVKGNSTSKIDITLNPKHVMEAAEQQQRAGGGRVIKDDFRLEYAVQGPNDVIEPRSSNVPQLIKDKKAANASSVLKKMLRCHVLLDVGDAASTVTDPASAQSNRAAGAGSRDNSRMSAKEMQESTWQEKNKRRETGASGNNGGAASGGPLMAGGAASGNGRAGAGASRQAAAPRTKILIIILSILAAGAIWMMME